jgi:hypothetical protein
MKMRPKDFYCMTLWEFLIAKEHHEKQMVETWRQTRLTIHTMVKVMGGSKSVTNDLTKFLPLPFDDNEPKKLSREKDIENLLVIERFKRAGYLKPLSDGE